MAGMTVIVRPATADDARGIATVHVASWQWAYAGLLPAERLDALSVDDRLAGWARTLSDEKGDLSTLVAAEGETVVGFVSVGAGRDDVGGPEVAQLYALYLSPDQAGRGTGRRLHDEAVRRLGSDGFAMARLWVLRGNDRARRFYERQGWRAEDVSKTETLQEGFEADEVRYVRDL